MAEKNLNILIICFRMPWPLKDGGAIAMYNIAKGLYENGCKLTMLVPLTSKHDISIDELPAELKNMAEIHTVRIKSEITALGAIKNLFTNESYYISRYYHSNFNHKLIELLSANNYDVVQIESLKMVGYLNTIRQHSNARVAMRSHNIEFLIWDRMADACTNFVKKWYLGIITKRTKKLELKTLNDFDAIVPITEVDGKFFIEKGCQKPVFASPTGYVKIADKPEPEKAEPNSIFFIGALDWMPNFEALRWFYWNSWPIIHSKYPSVKFYIAGRNMPEDIKKYESQNVIIVGEVENAVDFMNSKQIMIVPLLSGSGMRIKIIEGMALGKVIISTTVGAEGICCTNLKNILIADTALEFAEIIGRLIEDSNFSMQISRAAIDFVDKHYNNHLICKQLVANYIQLMK